MVFGEGRFERQDHGGRERRDVVAQKSLDDRVAVVARVALAEANREVRPTHRAVRGRRRQHEIGMHREAPEVAVEDLLERAAVLVESCEPGAGERGGHHADARIEADALHARDSADPLPVVSGVKHAEVAREPQRVGEAVVVGDAHGAA